MANIKAIRIQQFRQAGGAPVRRCAASHTRLRWIAGKSPCGFSKSLWLESACRIFKGLHSPPAPFISGWDVSGMVESAGSGV